MGERRTAGDTRDVGRTLTARVGAVLSTWVTSRCSTLPDRAQRWGCVWEQSVRTTTIARSLSNNGSLVAGCPQKAATSPTPFSTCAPAPSASLSSSTRSTRLTRWTLLTRGTLGGGRFGLARWWSCGPPNFNWKHGPRPGSTCTGGKGDMRAHNVIVPTERGRNACHH